MSSKYEWKGLSENTDSPDFNLKINWNDDEERHHPLEPKSVVQIKSDASNSATKKKTAKKTITADFVDPLSLLGGGGSVEDDEDEDLVDDDGGLSYGNNENNENWRNVMKPSEDKNDNSEIRIKVPSPLHTLLDKLEDDSEDLSSKSKLELLEMTNKHAAKSENKTDEYIKKGLGPNQFLNLVSVMNNQLAKYWKDDQRTQAIKLVINACKMMANNDSNIEFYPVKFFYLSDLISQFGKMVYSRIISKCPGLKMNFSADDVTESAQELARNWMLRIDGISELLPRFYMEVSFLKCYKIINDRSYTEIITRLSKSIRGIADPLVANYARCYLTHVTQTLNLNHDFTLKIGQVNYKEFFLMNYTAGKSKLKPHLFKSVINWLIQCTLYGCINDKDRIMRKHYADLKNIKHYGLLLQALMDNSSDSMINECLSQITILVTNAKEIKSELIQTFGNILLKSTELNLSKSQRLGILNNTWSVVMTLDEIDSYMKCAEIWMEYVVKYLSVKEINTLLSDVLNHLNQMEDDKSLCNIFKVIFIPGYNVDYLSLSNFLPIFNFLTSKSPKIEIARLILDNLQSDVKISDQNSINVLMYLCQVLSDSINALTIGDETRQISSLINDAIRSVDYGDDYEMKLSFLTDCRGKFSKIDAVQIELIKNVNSLSMSIHRQVRGNHTKKTKGFVGACSAFTFITIPSVADNLTKMKLYLESAQTALINHCVGQGEACLKTAIALLSTAQVSEKDIREYLGNLMSLLLVVPDNVDYGTFYLIRGMVTAIQKREWTNFGLCAVYMDVLKLCTVANYEVYPYKINGLDGNDVLYGGDEEFKEIVDGVGSEVLAVLLEKIGGMEKPQELSWKLFLVLTNYCDFDRNPKLTSLGFKLFKSAFSSDKIKIESEEMIKKWEMAKPNPTENWKNLFSKIKQL